MPHTEAPFSVSFSDRGPLWTTRGENLEEFAAHVSQLEEYLADREAFAVGAKVVGQSVGPVTTVGTAPARDNQTGNGTASNVTPIRPAAANHGAPPGVEYPGDCPHGPRTYQDKMARGRPWRFWECALEWRKGDDAWNNARCKPENAKQVRA